MEREEVTHFVHSRLSLWCPVCGAGQNQGCKPVGGLRFRSHDEIATGTVPRPAPEPYTPTWEAKPARKDAPRPKGWTPGGWTN